MNTPSQAALNAVAAIRKEVRLRIDYASPALSAEEEAAIIDQHFPTPSAPPSEIDFCWLESQRTPPFRTWAEEIAHMRALGYELVPPDYHIPGWYMAAGSRKLFVNGPCGPREMTTCFDRPARDLGYPLFLPPRPRHPLRRTNKMAEPACKDCKFFDEGIRSVGGECRDPSKRIYPRSSAASEVECPWIHDGAEYTCRNWTAREERPVTPDTQGGKS